MKIGDRVFVRGYIDEIRKDTVIVRNDGGYFGTVLSEVTGELPSAQQDVPDTNVGDMISRKAAIDVLKGLPTWWADGGGYYGGAQPPMVALLDPEDAVSAIENLPSAQPERKMGKWIYNSPVTMKCDQCGFVIKDWDWHRFKFCPNCDCDMRGEQE